MTRTALGYPEDPRRLGDDYRYAARSDSAAFAARIPAPSHSVAYDRGNGSQYANPGGRPIRQEQIGSSTEQGRLFRPAIPRTEERVGDAVPVIARSIAELARARHIERTRPG